MKPTAFILISIAILLQSARAQSLDTLLFTDQKIVGTVKEVTPETVSYTLSGRDVLFKLDKVHLIKICYGDGKVTESALINKKIIPTLEGWRDVAIAPDAEAIQGLYKIGEITMPGTAVGDRGKEWLKLESAMTGGNIVHVSGFDQFTSTSYFSTPIYYKNHNPTYYSRPSTTMYSVTHASVYTSKPLDSSAFKMLINQRSILSWVGHFKHQGSRLASTDCSHADTRIIRYEVEEHNIYVWLDLHGYKTTKFHVNYFEKNRILLSYKNSWTGRNDVLVFLVKPATYF